MRRIARFRIATWLFALPLPVLGLWLMGVPFSEPTMEYSSIELDRHCHVLRQELDEEWRRREAGVLAVGYVGVTRAEPGSVPTLGNQLEQYLRQASATNRSNTTDDLWQLAEATLAVAQHRYSAARQILDDMEAKPRTQVNTTLAVRVRRLHGDALFGLDHWEAALACYQESSEGLMDETKICVCLTHLVEQQGRRDLRDDLAHRLNQLGLQLYRQGWLDDAVVVYLRSTALWEEIAAQSSDPEASIQLAGTLNNCGIALQNSGRLEHAIPLFDRAITLQTQFVINDVDGRVTRHLADTFCNRGSALFDLGESQQALDDLNESVKIFQEQMEEHDGSLVRNLFSALNNRAWTQHRMGQHAAAIEDVDAAIMRLNRVASQTGRESDLRLMVTSLANRAAISRESGNAEQAIKDIAQAMEMVSAGTGQPEWDELLAICLAERGAAWRDLGNVSQAIADLEESVSRIELHSDLTPGLPVPSRLAHVFDLLADVRSSDDGRIRDTTNAD